MHATRIEGRQGNCRHCDSREGGMKMAGGAQKHGKKCGIFNNCVSNGMRIDT